jgi:fumarate reductase subunit C
MQNRIPVFSAAIALLLLVVLFALCLVVRTTALRASTDSRASFVPAPLVLFYPLLALPALHALLTP